MSDNVTYPPDPAAYQLLAEVGQGATAVVYRALCVPLDKEVAVKIINLENTGMAIEQFQRETTIMSRSSHRNVLKLYVSFVHGDTIWIILEYHPYGSAADVLRAVCPNGFQDEAMVSALLFQGLQALEYFHENRQMHRDVKASNLLVAGGGDVRMADFGVSGEAPSCRRSVTRVTFVGTPCWMAPEVLTLRGYRKSADIWSLGITALELAFGSPPYSQHQPMKVMALILKADPPTVDSCGPNSFSPAFKDFVAQCLQKDAAARPTASHLLRHPLMEPFRADPSLATATVAQGFKRWQIPPLQQLPVRRREPHKDDAPDWDFPGEEGSDQQPGSGGKDDWDFPSGVGALPQELEATATSWRRECLKSHSLSIQSYTQVSQFVQVDNLTIFSAQDKRKPGGEPVAIHELELDKDKYVEPHVKDELADCVLGIVHPGVFPCRELWEDGVRSVYWVTDAKPCGTLAQHVAQGGPLPPAVVCVWAFLLASALAHLHSQGVILRRLSSLTIAMVNDGRLEPKIDIATILLVPKIIKYPDAQAEAYMPPEQFDDTYSNKVDIYALGMVILEMLAGKPGYAECRNPMKLVQLKLRGKPPAALAALPPELADFKELIMKLTDPEPSQRPDATEVASHPLLARPAGCPGEAPAPGSG
eukprot:TRINITY_DN17167_c0_g1_i1.p1 TRINITY_DN17167_c0_g1~~TRINITY_DN17167_c0_g1_i1.p1  ORF type:complete len:647 (+),score=173.45 TRINITY_DN17167_c0_g1_i1:155-2095(+)